MKKFILSSFVCVVLVVLIMVGCNTEQDGAIEPTVNEELKVTQVVFKNFVPDNAFVERLNGTLATRSNEDHVLYTMKYINGDLIFDCPGGCPDDRMFAYKDVFFKQSTLNSLSRKITFNANNSIEDGPCKTIIISTPQTIGLQCTVKEGRICTELNKFCQFRPVKKVQDDTVTEENACDCYASPDSDAMPTE